ncbi:glycerol-3-phosphate dehydrogenase [Lachancea thermotolerans CBS 6340]|uniref:Glycerol-3-phosphate dehydrogenase n=1 Tax=Lachancea thermotolerans (strain ATCC 56472 / CBS 6340 / NRRL Y-8284) TaxID=559295 RepID=C5DH26_LACTC|nr:KLTH0E00836p [Lachancea thermotolerans CBS 6340]CAR23087.1 KLTH0E00836p [Lachancea thermotolerans CBS 6340]
MFARTVSRRVLAGATLAAGGYAAFALQRDRSAHNEVHVSIPLKAEAPAIPSRSELLDKMAKTDQFDVLVIGGGATGTGCAVDGATRGLNVALVEMNDFASGTSSKSTKMAHGGVRYLEKAFWELSKAQLDLVIEALNERGHMLNTAPHLCKVLPIMIPVYNYWQVPYFYVGCKMYDLFAGSQNLKSSYMMTARRASEVAPMLDASILKAGLVYHDGSFNDSRMNAALAVTAIERGATVLNYMEVTRLLKNEKTGRVEGAMARDRETGKEFRINAKVVVNSTGPFSDRILQMDNAKDGLPRNDLVQFANEGHDSIGSRVAVSNPRMVVPSAGVHIVLPAFYCPKQIGLLDAKTSDGRVMFFLPWQGKVLAGTTDIPMKQVPENPTATEADIQDILKELQHYIKFPVKREDVLSAWAGIRPLVRDPRTLKEGDDVSSTQGLVRNHFLFTSDNGLVTIAGGKWTTYREMAEETIDEVVKQGHFQAKPCITKKIKLAGAEGWDPNFVAMLAQEYHLSSKMAEHLANNYGTRSPIICEMFRRDEKNQLPVTFGGRENVTVYKNVNFDSFRYPFTIAELKYSVKYEYTRTALDFLMRRTRFGFLDAKQALEAVKGTVSIMGDELGWDENKRLSEIQQASDFIKTFGV